MIHNYSKKLINASFFISIGLLLFTNVNAQTPIGASPYIVPSSGNYTIPAGITQISVECIGGGGAGGGSGNANAYRGGGGGGAYVQVTNYTVSPGGILTIQVGAGGAGVNTTAVVNGQPSFVTYNSTTFVSAAGGSGTGSNTGGAGGQIASNIPANTGFAGGNGGNGASCCTFNKAAGGGGSGAGTTGAGNNGGNGTTTSTAWTGGAGGSLKANFGGAGGAGISSDANCPANTGGAAPANATNYGGGGGGCTQYAGACGTASTGGSGARGLVRITYNSCATPGQPDAITPTSVCQGVATTLTTSATGSPTSYTWSLPNGWTGTSTAATISVTANAGGNVTVTANNGCGSSSPTSTNISLTPAAVAPTAITGTTAICSGTSTTLTATGGDTTTRWFTGSCGGTQVGTGTSFTTPNLSTSTTYYAANRACGVFSSCASTTVTIKTAAVAPTAITGTTAICSGTSTTLTATGGDTTTRWFTGSCGGTQVGTGASFTTPNLSTATNYYAANRACGVFSSCASTTVTIKTAAVAPTAITGTTAICSGTSTILSATGGDTTTRWFTGSCGGTQVGAGASFTTPNLATATTYYAANRACGVFSSCASTTVNITPAAVAPSAITGTTTICSGSTTTLTATGGDANTKWFTGSCGGTQVSTGASYTTGQLTGNATYYAANVACGTTTSCASAAVTVNTKPNQPAAITPTSVCQGVATTLTTSATGSPSSYTWSLPNGWTGTSTAATISVTSNATSGNVTVTANNTCGASTPTTTNITVTPGAVAPSAITGTTTLCSGSTTTLTATGGDANTKWYTGSCGGTQVGTGVSYTTGQLSGNATYYAANVACGNITSCASATVTVNTKPNQPSAITPTSVCQGVATTLTTSATGSPSSYTWSLPNGWTGTSTAATISVISNATSGNVTVTANNTCGVSTPTSSTIGVSPLPTVTLSPFSSVCTVVAPFALTGGSPTGGAYSVNGVVASNFNPTGNARIDTITYLYIDGNSCSALATQNIQVKICLGIEESTLNTIKIFPNPVKDELTISIDKGSYDIVVIDAVGRTIENYKWTVLQAEEKKINTTAWNSGVYFMYLHEKSRGVQFLKFIKL